MSFAVYTEGSSGGVYKDGHRMFIEDVVKELNRKSYLEEKILQTTNRQITPFCTHCGTDKSHLVMHTLCQDCASGIKRRN